MNSKFSDIWLFHVTVTKTNKNKAKIKPDPPSWIKEKSVIIWCWTRQGFNFVQIACSWSYTKTLNKTSFFVKSHFIETSTVPPVKMSEELPAGRSAMGSRACKTCRVIMWALHYNICFDKWAVACKTYLGLSRGLTTKFLFRNFCQIKIQKSLIFKIKIARASPKHVFEKSCTIILNFCTTLSCIHRKRPQKCPKTSRWNRF